VKSVNVVKKQKKQKNAAVVQNNVTALNFVTAPTVVKSQVVVINSVSFL